MGAVTDWERPGAWERAMDHWSRANAAIEAIITGKGPQLFREPAAVAKGSSPVSAGGSGNAPMAPRGVEDSTGVQERGSVDSGEGCGASTEADSGPRAAVFGAHLFRWERSEKHGELEPRLQGRKGERCLVRAVSLVRKPWEPHVDLFAGKRPEPGTHSVLIEFADGYQVVTSMWAIRKVA